MPKHEQVPQLRTATGGERSDARSGDLRPGLIDAFRAGESDALREVHRRYAGAIATVARSVVGSEADLVQDVVQQTMLKAWRASQRFDGDRPLAPWLYAIARRTAIDVLRTERRPTQGGHAPEVDQAVETTSMERVWVGFEVRRAIDELPPGDRDVMRLLHLDGLTQREVAERLDLPLGTVKSRAHRATRQLAATLGHLRGERWP